MWIDDNDDKMNLKKKIMWTAEKSICIYRAVYWQSLWHKCNVREKIIQNVNQGGNFNLIFIFILWLFCNEVVEKEIFQLLREGRHSRLSFKHGLK